MPSRRRHLGHLVAFGCSTIASMLFGSAVVACSYSYAESGAADGGAVPVPPDEGGLDGALRDDDAAPMPDAAPLVLASGHFALSGIAASESTVYFTEQGKGGVHSVPIDGNGPELLLTALGGTPSSIALVGGELFWTDLKSNTLNRVSTGGGDASSVSRPINEPLRALAAAANGIVVAVTDGTNTGQVQHYTLGFSGVATVPAVVNPFGVALFGASVFWTESGAGTVARGSFGDSSRVTISTSEIDAQSIAADALGVYWTRPAMLDVRAKLAGSAGISTIASQEDSPSSIAADGTSIYWISNTGIRRARAHSPGKVETMATGFPALRESRWRSLAVTSKYVVWLSDDGSVRRMSK
jgi:hypothetical protein